MHLGNFKVPEKIVNDRVKTRWQDEVSKMLVDFKIDKYMHSFVWKKIGKGGCNFPFIESRVNTLKQSLKEKGQSLDKSGALFIHVLKQK